MVEARAYTFKELEELRQMVSFKYLYGTYEPSGCVSSRSYKESEMVACVEEQVRTFILAGITPQDIREQVEKERQEWLAAAARPSPKEPGE